MGDRNSIGKPLLAKSRTGPAPRSSPSRNDAASGGLVFRLAFLSLVGALAVWASLEASKGFQVTVVNGLSGDSRAGQRFDLFYVSNDAATRVLLNASDFVENLLYGGGGGGERKPVSHVTLRLAGAGFPGGVSVVKSPGGEEGGFVVDLSPDLMDASDSDVAVRSAVLRGMARVWVWDNGAPSEVLSGVAEYVAMAAGFGGEYRLEDSGRGVIGCGRDHGDDWFADKDPRFVARLLDRCEEEERGFIGRLNGAMRHGWHDRTVEDALGKPARLCLCVPDH